VDTFWSYIKEKSFFNTVIRENTFLESNLKSFFFMLLQRFATDKEIFFDLLRRKSQVSILCHIKAFFGHNTPSFKLQHFVSFFAKTEQIEMSNFYDCSERNNSKVFGHYKK